MEAKKRPSTSYRAVAKRGHAQPKFRRPPRIKAPVSSGDSTRCGHHPSGQEPSLASHVALRLRIKNVSAFRHFLLGRCPKQYIMTSCCICSTSSGCSTSSCTRTSGRRLCKTAARPTLVSHDKSWPWRSDHKVPRQPMRYASFNNVSARFSMGDREPHKQSQKSAAISL